MWTVRRLKATPSDLSPRLFERWITLSSLRTTWARGLFLEGPKKFLHPESRSKISNPNITALFYSHILNMNRGSLHTRSFRHIHLLVYRYRLSKNGFAGLKSSRGFQETFTNNCKGTVTWLISRVFLLAFKLQQCKLIYSFVDISPASGLCMFKHCSLAWSRIIFCEMVNKTSIANNVPCGYFGQHETAKQFYFLLILPAGFEIRVLLQYTGYIIINKIHQIYSLMHLLV